MSQRGLSRERALKHQLAGQGWVAVRASMGIVDLVLLRRARIDVITPHSEVRLVQVKSTSGGPYERFGPAERQELLDLARQAGASAWLIWWPPRIAWRWIPSREWPASRSTGTVGGVHTGRTFPAA